MSCTRVGITLNEVHLKASSPYFLNPKFPMSQDISFSHALPTATRWIHHFIAQRDWSGKVVVDATAGNGHDTLFLLQQVGRSGHVHAFDLQAQAIAQTRQRLEEHQIDSQTYTLHHRSHAELAEALPIHLKGNLHGVMFNLGYLPGGDKSIITHVDSTLQAIRQALEWIEENGIVTIAAYPGHEGGKLESLEVEQLLSALSPTHFEVQKIAYLNFRPTTPVSYLIRKRTAEPA